MFCSYKKISKDFLPNSPEKLGETVSCTVFVVFAWRERTAEPDSYRAVLYFFCMSRTDCFMSAWRVGTWMSDNLLM